MTCNIERIAAQSFAEHVMQGAPAKSWRLGKPGTGAYAFWITWAPGILVVSGDIGSDIYELWPAFNTLESAVDLVSDAGFCYLTSKAGIRDEFDRGETVKLLLEGAYQDLRNGYQQHLFAQLCEEYGGDEGNPIDRKEAARSFRDDYDLTAERVYNITGDFEAPCYRPPSSARWAYEAVKLWAAKMQAAASQTGEAA